MDSSEPEAGGSPATTSSDITDNRHRRLLYAVASSSVSKSLAFVVQMLSLPIALHILGTDRYAAFLTLRGSLSWASLLTLGLIPTLPRFVAGLCNNGEPAAERELVRSAAALMLAIGLAVLLLLELLPLFVSPSALIGHSSSVSAHELFLSYEMVAILVPLQLAFSIMPAIRSGYQELHISSLWSALANIGVLALLFLVRDLRPNIGQLFYVMYFPLVFFLFCDTGLLLWQRPYLLPGRLSLGPVLRLIGPQALNGMGMQLSYFFLSYLPVVWLSHLTDAKSTAAYGSIMQLLLTGSAAMSLIFLPMVQAVANANAHNDHAWLIRAYRHAASIVGVISLAFMALLSLAGPWLARVWLNDDLGISHTLCILLGIYFVVLMSSMFHFYVLSALGELRGVGSVYITESVIATVGGLALTALFGVNGMAAGLVIATLCCSGWYLPTKVWRTLKLMTI